MTVRKYFMKDESYKAQISERVKENKIQQNNASEISSGEEGARPENFMQVLKVIMEDLSGACFKKSKTKSMNGIRRMDSVIRKMKPKRIVI